MKSWAVQIVTVAVVTAVTAAVDFECNVTPDTGDKKMTVCSFGKDACIVTQLDGGTPNYKCASLSTECKDHDNSCWITETTDKKQQLQCCCKDSKCDPHTKFTTCKAPTAAAATNNIPCVTGAACQKTVTKGTPTFKCAEKKTENCPFSVTDIGCKGANSTDYTCCCFATECKYGDAEADKKMCMKGDAPSAIMTTCASDKTKSCKVDLAKKGDKLKYSCSDDECKEAKCNNVKENSSCCCIKTRCTLGTPTISGATQTLPILSLIAVLATTLFLRK